MSSTSRDSVTGIDSNPVSGPELSFYANRTTIEQTQKQLSSSDRSSDSASSLNHQIPLLPNVLERQRLPFFSLLNYRTYVKSHSIRPRPITLIKKHWTYAKELSHRQSEHRSKDGRHIEVDASRTRPLVDEATGRPYARNGIRSNKYTPWTFIPRQLVAQFSKLANFYFLCFAIMQLIPGLSTIGNSTNIIPLMFFVSISMAKEGFDDCRRHRLDKKENRQETLVVNPGVPLVAGALNWQKVQWHYLRVGDIIKLKRDEPVPADIVLLGSSNLGERKVVYVETMALDGETNLKGKQAVKIVAEACATAEKLVASSIKFVIEERASKCFTSYCNGGLLRRRL